MLNRQFTKRYINYSQLLRALFGMGIAILPQSRPVHAADPTTLLSIASGSLSVAKNIISIFEAAEEDILSTNEFNEAVRAERNKPGHLKPTYELKRNKLLSCLEDNSFSSSELVFKAQNALFILDQRYYIARLILDYLTLFDRVYAQWQVSFSEENKRLQLEKDIKRNIIKADSDRKVLTQLNEMFKQEKLNLDSDFYYNYPYSTDENVAVRAAQSFWNKVTRTVKEGTPKPNVTVSNLSVNLLLIQELRKSRSPLKQSIVAMHDLYKDAHNLMFTHEEDLIQYEEDSCLFQYYKDKLNRYQAILNGAMESGVFSSGSFGSSPHEKVLEQKSGSRMSSRSPLVQSGEKSEVPVRSISTPLLSSSPKLPSVNASASLPIPVPPTRRKPEGEFVPTYSPLTFGTPKKVNQDEESDSKDDGEVRSIARDEEPEVEEEDLVKGHSPYSNFPFSFGEEKGIHMDHHHLNGSKNN